MRCRALRCLNAPDGPVANSLAPHVEKFGLQFMPEQLVGAGEIGEFAIRARLKCTKLTGCIAQ